MFTSYGRSRRASDDETATRTEPAEPLETVPKTISPGNIKRQADAAEIDPRVAATASAMTDKMGKVVWNWLVEVESERYYCGCSTDATGLGTGAREKENVGTTTTLALGLPSGGKDSPLLVDGKSLHLFLFCCEAEGGVEAPLEGVSLAAGMFATRHGLPQACGLIALRFVAAVICGAGLAVDGGPSVLQAEPFQRLLGDFAMHRDMKTHPFRNTAFFVSIQRGSLGCLGVGVLICLFCLLCA